MPNYRYMIYQDQEFLKYVASELVEHPGSIKVTRKIDPTGILLELEVHPEDMGRIIGRSGRTADAIRKLLWVIGTKNEQRISFKIIEPANSGFEGKQYNDLEQEQESTENINNSTIKPNPTLDPTMIVNEPVATSPDEANQI